MKTETYNPIEQAILVKIAHKQSELFSTVFDFATHEPRLTDKSHKFLFRKPKHTKQEQLLAELEELKYQLSSQPSGPKGIRWWQSSWSVIEYALCKALEEIPRKEGWRFETNLKSFSDNDGMRYVISSEEGSSQAFTQESIYEYDVISSLSEQERKERMTKYDRKVQDRYINTAIAMELNNANIQSILSDKVYDDVLDYYISEGWALDSMFRSKYEQKMYTDKYIEGISAHATARYRVNGLFAVGTYKTNTAGRLLSFHSLDYHPISLYPKEYGRILSERHIPGTAVLKLCEFLIQSEDVKTVPFSMLSKFAGVAETQEENNLTNLQSAIFTLLANKLTLE